jgi:hypothetical protein
MASYFGLRDTILVGFLFFLKQSKFRLQDKYIPFVGVALKDVERLRHAVEYTLDARMVNVGH